MNVILVDDHHGQTSTVVPLKGWLKALLSLCLLGAPVVMVYLGYQLALAQNTQHQSLIAQAWQEQLAQHARHLDFSTSRLPRFAGAQHAKLDTGLPASHRLPHPVPGSSALPRSPHFDRYKNGRLVDPAAYVQRTVR